jgi:selenophosphate synthetase-related protein
MKWEEAKQHIDVNGSIQRAIWSERLSVKMVGGQLHTKMKNEHTTHFWNLTQDDILATDWRVVLGERFKQVPDRIW